MEGLVNTMVVEGSNDGGVVSTGVEGSNDGGALITVVMEGSSVARVGEHGDGGGQQ